MQPAEADGVKAPLACINPKERFGHHYRVAYEESYYADYGPNARIEDPWLMVVLCKHGEICPWGGSILAACANKPGRAAKRLKSLPFTKVARDGDDGANVLFDIERFDLVVYDDTRQAARILEIKKRTVQQQKAIPQHEQAARRNRKQLARYRKFGLPVDHVAGPRNAKRYLAHVRQHALPDTPIVMLSQTKGNNEGKGK